MTLPKGSTWLSESTNLVAGPATAAAPTCRCKGAGLCTATQLAAFMLRAPSTVYDPRSPWMGYARAVYRAYVRVPLELRRFELLYPALLPVASCTLGPPATSGSSGTPFRLPLCNASRCARWLPNPRPSAQDVASFAANRTFIRTPAAAESDRRAFGHAVVLQRRIPDRLPLPRYSWVEVTRHREPKEGAADYGCWYYLAKGSGVWVFTRRLLSWRDRRNAWSALRAWTGRAHGSALGDSAYAKEVAARGWTGFEIVRSHGNAMGWHELGPTAGSHELVLAPPSCMHQPSGLQTGCTPVPTRAGWNASLPCVCRSMELLNCADS